MTTLIFNCSLSAETVDVETTNDIGVYLSNEDGERSAFLGILKGERVRDVIFIHRIGAQLKDYASWALEISEPTANLFSRVIADGKLPTLLHWDGKFDAVTSVAVNKKYFVRVLLIGKHNKAFASPWSSFQTRLKNPYDGKRASKSSIDLYIVPSGGVHTAFLKTSSFQTLQFPTISGDVRCIWKDDHTFGVRLETTTNIFSNYDVSHVGFFYSDFSLFYRYRLMGAPARAASLPYFPPYAGKSNIAPSLRIEQYSKPTNLEVGARVLSAVLRGYDNTVIESELAQSYMGASLSARFDQLLGPFRAHAGLEGGYSFFRGKVLVAGVEGAVTYERISNFSPGLQARIQLVRGNATDPTTGTLAEISNQILFTGLILYFKI